MSDKKVETEEVNVGQITIVKTDLYMITGALTAMGDWLRKVGLDTHINRASDYYDLAKRVDRLYTQCNYQVSPDEPLTCLLQHDEEVEEEEKEADLDEHREEAENDQGGASGEAISTKKEGAGTTSHKAATAGH